MPCGHNYSFMNVFLNDISNRFLLPVCIDYCESNLLLKLRLLSVSDYLNSIFTCIQFLHVSKQVGLDIYRQCLDHKTSQQRRMVFVIVLDRRDTSLAAL